MELIQSRLGIAQMFYILGGVYFVMMMLGHFLLKKPKGWVEPQDSRDSFRPLEMFRDKTFLGIWLMFFLNIHCGLALITYEKQILSTAFAGGAAPGRRHQHRALGDRRLQRPGPHRLLHPVRPDAGPEHGLQDHLHLLHRRQPPWARPPSPSPEVPPPPSSG